MYFPTLKITTLLQFLGKLKGSDLVRCGSRGESGGVSDRRGLRGERIRGGLQPAADVVLLALVRCLLLDVLGVAVVVVEGMRALMVRARRAAQVSHLHRRYLS